MKATLALIISLIAFLVVVVVTGTLASGTIDVYQTVGVIFIVPYTLFFYFGWKRKAWAYLGSTVLSVLSIVAVPLSTPPYVSGQFLWDRWFGTMVLALVALEGFKSYLQLRTPQ